MSELHSYIDENLPRFREELFEFLRIPSVSARSEHHDDMRRCAEGLADKMRAAGLEATIEETGGHPVVLGEWRGAGEAAPTILIYGHYDVQPPEPLELWSSPPFEPEVRDGKIYARGSVDDKGQLYLHLKAIEAHLAVHGKLPVNIVLLIEGEEEVGSENLMPFLEANKERLAADAIVISDTGMVGPGIPTIGTSLRGLVYFEIEVEGPAQDLHSGAYGGAVINPATALAKIIARLHDDDWHAQIPGFYDAVDTPAEVLEGIERVPFDEAAFLAETGAVALGGEAGYSTLERLWTRPTVEINGMISGYTGEGAKTVLPSTALAKVSCRLVPDQDPEVIRELFEAYIEEVKPEGVRVEVRYLHGGQAWRARVEGDLYRAAERALEQAFGKPPVYAGEGGSIPIVPGFEEVLEAPALLMGFGLPGQNAHAPDEWMSVENFEKGTHASAALLSELGSSRE